MNALIKLANSKWAEGVELSDYAGAISLVMDAHEGMYGGRVVIGHGPAEAVQTLQALINALVGTNTKGV